MSDRYNQIIEQIQAGIEAELADTPQFFEYRIAAIEKEGEIWKVHVDLTDERSRGLDESLEGSSAWWAGPSNGGADVLSVIPENEQINLRFVTNTPPGSGKLIRLYPPRYLEALQSCWSDHNWATQCLGWAEIIEDSNSFDQNRVPKKNPFSWLRNRQIEAFNLVGWKAGFLWGPPGTGKTTTLGCILAQCLVEHPDWRILLFSTTNFAVDLALIAVDKALEEIGKLPEAAGVRKQCYRIGNHFIAGNYKGREHLLPVKDTTLIRLLSELEVKRPQREQVQHFAIWKQEVEKIRQEIKRQAARVLDSARLAALTTTRAVFTFSELKRRSPYDLIVFDEASQVGIAHGLAIAPLGTHCLFAGDPKQLSAIVQSEDRMANRYLGTSMFKYMDDSQRSACFLNEQSRMVEDICRIVSNVFYKSELIVAKECKQDPEWKKKRRCAYIDPIGDNNACVLSIKAEGQWSHRFHGPIRYESAELIRELVYSLLIDVDEGDIIVLTPFRAQRSLIKSFLKNADLKKVAVSTVHRAQGSEQHTVIFDPVMGKNPFLQTEEAERLINVALSRSRARLILVLSEGDRTNSLLDQIAVVIENPLPTNVIPIEHLASRSDFPDCAKAKVVQIKNIIGKIIEVIDGGKSFVLHDSNTGKKRTYKTSLVKEKFGKNKI